MVDQSFMRPIEILSDVIVKVDNFILPVDFMVLDWEMEKKIPIILVRSFLATKRAIVDLEFGEMRFILHEDEVFFQLCNSKR